MHHRRHIASRPFIGTLRDDFELTVYDAKTPLVVDGGVVQQTICDATTTNGVLCKGPDSPHLVGPHAEVAAHVDGLKAVSTISDIVDKSGLFGHDLPVLVVDLEPSLVVEKVREPLGDVDYGGGGKKRISSITFSNGESYAVADASDAPIKTGSARFVTHASMKAWVESNSTLCESFKAIKGPKVVVIHYLGYSISKSPMNSPAMTIEAAHYLLSEFGPTIVGTNAPSFDLQSEGGVCVVHKALFRSGVQVLLESLLINETAVSSIRITVEQRIKFDDVAAVVVKWGGYDEESTVILR